MKPNEFELPVTISLSILALLFVRYLNKRAEKQNPKSLFEPGQFFDRATYTGHIRAIILGFLVIFGGRHIDEAGQWLWRQFGNELVVTPEKARWHATVALGLGLLFVIPGIASILRVYNDRQRKKESRHKTDDEGNKKGRSAPERIKSLYLPTKRNTRR